MTNTAKRIAYYQKKLEHLDNDLLKDIAIDMAEILFNFRNSRAQHKEAAEHRLKSLKNLYIYKIRSLQNKQKQESKQIDLEDAIAEAKKTQFKHE